MSARLVRRVVAGCIGVLVAQGVSAQSSATIQLSTARAANATAKNHLAAGDYAEAQRLYDRVITEFGRVAAADGKGVVSEAYFGPATAMHQVRRVGDAGAAESSAQLRAALAGCDSAQALDPERFAGAANNNAGLLLRDAGRHREATRDFSPPRRPLTPHARPSSCRPPRSTRHSAKPIAPLPRIARH